MLFWDYVKCHQTECYPLTGPKKFNDTCSARCAASIGVQWSTITDCITASGGLDHQLEAENTLLAQELNFLTGLGIFSIPTMLVNGMPYRGSLVCSTPIDVTRCGPLGMICEVLFE
jgi:hypothetical protein